VDLVVADLHILIQVEQLLVAQVHQDKDLLAVMVFLLQHRVLQAQVGAEQVDQAQMLTMVLVVQEDLVLQLQ
jgi:hypothetical protein